MLRMAGRGVGSAIAPAANWAALRDGLVNVWRHRELTWELVRRDLGAQFAGQIVGRLWIFAHPLMTFAVYVFVFALVLKARIATNAEMPRDYTTYILSGLAPWLATQQVLARAPSVLIAQANLVKQVVFPIEVLPVGAVAAAGVPLIIGLAVVIIRLLLLADIPWTLLLLPAAIVLHAAFLLGIAYVLSVATPFFRDLKDIVSVLTLFGVYAVPAFYLPQWVPELIRPWLYLNPFSYVIWVYQDCLYFGAIKHPGAWVALALLALLSLALGLRTFRKLKPFVANVL